jgi:hypothetical protein
MPTTKLPDTLHDAQALVLAELQQHPFVPLTHFNGKVHPRLLHEALYLLAADRRVNVTNGHLHLATPSSADGQDVTMTAVEQIVKVLAAEHHPRSAVWIELALPVELAPAVPDALTILLLDGKISAVKTPNRSDRYRLV